ncbi:MAG TPA: hypothetical protein VJW16_06660, partial [Lysobacter sp.]|nr:hypothetical protein [Lysobacter sp.]
MGARSFMLPLSTFHCWPFSSENTVPGYQQPVQCRQLRGRERVQPGLVHFFGAQALFETDRGILRLCRHCSRKGQGGAQKHLS